MRAVASLEAIMAHRVWRLSVLLASASMGLTPLQSRAQEGASPDDVVATLEKLSGVHKGFRRNHAKGDCASGAFQAGADARALSISPLFSGQPIPVTARFSVAGPNPAAPDKANSPRGMALQFQLPDGALQNMAMLNVPVFAAATPQAFLELLQVGLPDPATGKPDPAKLQAYIVKYPEFKGFADWSGAHKPPPSYAEVAYYSVHAFKFVDSGKQEHWVKWRFAPRDGEAFMTDAELAAAPGDFLADRLAERLRKGPAVWDMIIILGEKGDAIDNPTIPWPATRREIKGGVLTLSKAGGQADGQCDGINFDPNLVSAGVEPSPDPVLAFRSSAYAVSYGKRLEEGAK
jgi:catalase